MGIRIVLILLCAGFSAAAHEVRPSYLQLKEKSTESFEAIWKIPSLNDKTPPLRLQLNEVNIENREFRQEQYDNFVVRRGIFNSKIGLRGQSIKVHGLENTLIDVLVRIEFMSGETIIFTLKPDQNQQLVPMAESRWQTIETYGILGIEHILFGFDHLLFVLALVLIANGTWKIVKMVTAFTLAHSVTLSMAALGFVDIPGSPVEAIIALSIVFVALEIIQVQNGHQSLTQQKPWLVAFIFGLLHGFGFAGALSEIGLPANDIPWALAFFNIGVEIGQLAFVFVILLLIGALSRVGLYRKSLIRTAAYFIGCVSSYWLIDRLVGFIA